MKKIEYYARAGAPFKKEKAQIYGERLEEISSKNKGKITPTLVIDDAKNIKSPFHDYFEWNNDKASEQYRLHQARSLINHVVEVVVIEGKPSKQRSFFAVTNGNSQKVYVTIKKAVTTPNYRIQILNQLITTLKNATNLMELFKSYEK